VLGVSELEVRSRRTPTISDLEIASRSALEPQSDPLEKPLITELSMFEAWALMRIGRDMGVPN